MQKPRFRIFILALCLLFEQNSFAQNLISNGSFEDKTTSDCVIISDGFQYLTNWYNSIGTPDLFEAGCPVDEGFFPFWVSALPAREGNNYIGMVGLLLYTGTFYSEGIGTSLPQTLEEDRLYLLEMSIRPKGISANEDEPYLCETTPAKSIGIYTSPDSILTTRERNGALTIDSYSNGDLVAQIRDEKLDSKVIDTWSRYSTCFQAKGNEKHLSISLPLGQFEIEPNCFIAEEVGSFHLYYYDFDAIELRALPRSFEIERNFCLDEGIVIDLQNTEELPDLEDTQFLWDNGSTNPERTLSEEGIYRAELILECGRIPIEIQLTTRDCKARVFVPNVFSPNRDGVNDTLRPFIDADFPITNYQFQVFDRWGGLLFGSTNNSEEWDGQANGRPLSPGTYFWVLRYDNATETITEAGVSVLLR